MSVTALSDHITAMAQGPFPPIAIVGLVAVSRSRRVDRGWWFGRGVFFLAGGISRGNTRERDREGRGLYQAALLIPICARPAEHEPWRGRAPPNKCRLGGFVRERGREGGICDGSRDREFFSSRSLLAIRSTTTGARSSAEPLCCYNT